MKIFFRYFGVLVFISLYITACSGVETTVREDESKQTSDSIYVFDIPEDSTFDVTEKDPEESNDSLLTFVRNTSKDAKTRYAVQLGAFGEEKNAKTHVANSKKLLKEDIRYYYSKEVNFWVVQLTPVETAAMAHKIKRELRKKKGYKDAFVVKVIE